MSEEIIFDSDDDEDTISIEIDGDVMVLQFSHEHGDVTLRMDRNTTAEFVHMLTEACAVFFECDGDDEVVN